MNSFYRCADCGAYLDPGEHCDCKEEKKKIKSISPAPEVKKIHIEAVEYNRPDNKGRIAI